MGLKGPPPGPPWPNEPEVQPVKFEFVFPPVPPSPRAMRGPPSLPIPPFPLPVPPAPPGPSLLSPPAPPPPAATTMGLSPRRTSDAPPPPPPPKPFGAPPPPGAPPLNPPAPPFKPIVSPPRPPTLISKVWPGVTVIVEATLPPEPGAPPFGPPRPPSAPATSTFRRVTPSGTTKFCGPPVKVNVSATVSAAETTTLSVAIATSAAAIAADAQTIRSMTALPPPGGVPALTRQVKRAPRLIGNAEHRRMLDQERSLSPSGVRGSPERDRHPPLLSGATSPASSYGLLEGVDRLGRKAYATTQQPQGVQFGEAVLTPELVQRVGLS